MPLRSTFRYELEDVSLFKHQLLIWAQKFDVFAWLDSNSHQDPYGEFDVLLAVGVETSLTTGINNAFTQLRNYRAATRDWIFGYLSYDLKNELELLSSGGIEELEFPEMYFFQPLKIIRVKGNTVEFDYTEAHCAAVKEDLEAILTQSPPEKPHSNIISIKLRVFKDEYYSRVKEVLNHIQRGDIYELNYCQEFFAREAEIDPLHVYLQLNKISQPPFAAFFRINDHFILSASPERFLKKSGNKIISQPIKGTARRDLNEALDMELRNALATDPKERAENIMITDLVRNDLSKQAVKGSVKVAELCGIYTYEQVHQMISTIEATMPEGTDPVDIIQNAFPMGSMTGAPKISAMKLIERYETSMRGVYSGALGYFTPDDDFDFNVVIRTILYNKAKCYLSFSVGSAITSRSIAENEYQECLVKARAMRSVLEHQN